MTSPTVAGAVCPICSDDAYDPLARIQYEETWSRFERDFGAVIPMGIRDANAPLDEVSLVRCSTCGLDRFVPMVPGDAAFYDALMSAVPYTVDRWDFRVARAHIGETVDVLDLGCGEGRFLSSLGARVGRTAGVDHNGAAIARFVSRGGEGHVGSFEEFASTHAGEFDVVTAFHTLEHVPDPIRMLRAAATCLRSGGTLYVSVPNRERTWRDHGEPMDRPPHHVTRWGRAQIEAAAERAGLRVQSVAYEPPNLSVARALIERSIVERLPTRTRPFATIPARLASMVVMPSTRHARAVARGTFLERGIYGHTLLAVLRNG
jgi:SAM-dependent methyltransferase